MSAYSDDCPQWKCPHISVEERRDGVKCSTCLACSCPEPTNPEENK